MDVSRRGFLGSSVGGAWLAQAATASAQPVATQQSRTAPLEALIDAARRRSANLGELMAASVAGLGQWWRCRGDAAGDRSLRLRGYDFHFRFGEGTHSIAQGALDLPESLAWLWRDYDPECTGQTYEQEASERAKPIFRVRIANRDPW